ncbi:MAG: leucine-rich repeat domain-containing protein [Bacteroidaceae bacterium]|nr:leucine-rich repeat domain-containing protein [Bacteroidaceae bacterium]
MKTLRLTINFIMLFWLIVQTAGAASYKIKIAGVDVTDANKDDLSVIDGVTGTVRYNSETNTLFLFNASITYSGSSLAAISVTQSMNIDVYQSCSITSSARRGIQLQTSANDTVTFRGNGTLDVSGGTHNGLWITQGTLIFDGPTVSFKATNPSTSTESYGIYGNHKNGGVSTVSVLSGTVKAYGEKGSFGNITTLQLGKKVSIIEPESVEFYDNYIYDPATEQNVRGQWVTIKIEDGYIPITASRFPDPTFRYYIDDYRDGVLSPSELNRTRLSFAINKISDLTGIEYFKKLSVLNVEENNITKLDLSANTALKELKCGKNPLTTLILPPGMEIIKCAKTQLTSLDLSDQTSLQTLDASDCSQLSQFNLPQTLSLTELSVTNSQLTNLDFTGCSNLEKLYCNDNKLTSLYVSHLSKLTHLNCAGNNLSTLYLQGNTALKTLSCDSCQLTSINLSGLTNLTRLLCSNNQLTQIDLSQCPKLTYLNCAKNQLKSLEFDHSISGLICQYNQLTTLTVDILSSYTDDFDCSHNQLTSLNVTFQSGDSDKYIDFDCSYNMLYDLNIPTHAKIRYLHCNDNKLVNLRIPSVCSFVDCWNNRISDDLIDAFINSLPINNGPGAWGWEQAFIRFRNLNIAKNDENATHVTKEKCADAYENKKMESCFY